jgi:environmental stress-induced protein Ves
MTAMAIHRFARNALPVTPWKNGGGSTREIVSWPPGAGIDAFDWRASIATIAASGPFSVFAGVDRTIMLLEGDGVRLQAAGLDHWLDQPHAPFGFSGDVPVDCTLLGGEDASPRGGDGSALGRPGGGSTDFNVMSRRARGRAELRVIDSETVLERIAHGLLMTLDGQWRMGGGLLHQGEGVWWAEQDEKWHVKPASRGALLLAVGWRPLSKI